MEYKYYTADVFTNQLFNGAHVAVFPDALGLNDEMMQQIARELNLSETVFIFPRGQNNKEQSKSSHRLRIFNPEEEVNFAGHPIIATGHVLAMTGKLGKLEEESALSLKQNVGNINAYVKKEADNKSFVQFSLEDVNANIDLFVPDTQELADFLNLDEKNFKLKYFSPKIITTEQSYLVIPVKDLEAIQKAEFDYSAWSRSSAPASNARQILLFTNKTVSQKGNFHLRLLGPNIGKHDDPPVGSSIPAFTAYLNSFKEVQTGTHIFVVERGREETRHSTLQVEAVLSKKHPLKIRIGGSAVSVSEAKINLPDNTPVN